MTPGNFEKQNQKNWEEFDRLLNLLDAKAASPSDVARLPAMFRQTCSDLSIAQHRMYGIRMIDRINRLVMRGYRHLYGETGGILSRFQRFISTGLPRLVRREWNLFFICNLVFWVPFLGMMKSAEVDPRWVQATLGPEGMAQIEGMWGEGRDLGEEPRTSGQNFFMFGFYVINNIGIDFKTFAGGLACGLGTLFYLLFNGFHLGAAFGYVNEVGATEQFYLFVVGHSSFEMLGMILSGMGGLRLGLAILHPGRQLRSTALIQAGKIAILLLAGAALLTFIAAIVESFWSPNDFAPSVKYAFGASMWAFCYLYFLLAGRIWNPDQWRDLSRRVLWLAGSGVALFLLVVALDRLAEISLSQVALWGFVVACGLVLLQERGEGAEA